jgi:hypothetical protein
MSTTAVALGGYFSGFRQIAGYFGDLAIEALRCVA